MKSAGEITPWAKASSQAPLNPCGFNEASPRVERAIWPTEDKAMTALMSVARITEREERSKVCTPIPKRSGAFKAVRAGSDSRRI